MARSAWEYPHLSGYEFWEDYEDYKESRAEGLGVSGGAGFCWWDQQWWYDEWIDLLAEEYGFGFREIQSLNLVEAFRLKTAINRRKDRTGYVEWRALEDAQSGEDKPTKDRKSKRILKQAYASAENFSAYIRGHCGYAD